MDLIIRLDMSAQGDVSVVFMPGAGMTEAQAAYAASALGEVLDWDALYADLLGEETVKDAPAGAPPMAV